MKRKNMTRNALITSAIALLLCVSMLVGATFAWFTDEVVSGSNVIASGNLDIAVEYTLDGETWKDLNGANDLFSIDLWEPGHTEVVALRVTNKGTLALKYVASMNIAEEIKGTNKAGEEFALSDYLTVSTLTQAANEIGDITVMLAYAGENRVAYENTVAFKEGNILRATQELHTGDAHYLLVKVDMPETVGNEANHNGNAPSINFGINVLATQYTYENDTFGNDYDKDTEIPTVVASAAELQAALDNAADGDVIALAGDIEGAVTVAQKPDVAVTIDGRGYDYQGTITVDGKSSRYATAGLTITNVNFAGGAAAGADAYVALGGNNSTRYTDNVTIKNCTFSAEGENVVAVKSYTGGDYNVVIEDCVVNAGMHSLAQLANVEKGLKIVDCKVYSKNGANLNNTLALEMSGCTFDVKGYAVRFGTNGDVNAEAKAFQIANTTLKSACAESDDAVIVFRATSTNATLNLVNTTVEGAVKVLGNTEATVINGL